MIFLRISPNARKYGPEKLQIRTLLTYSGKFFKTHLKTAEIIPFLVNLQAKTVNLLPKETIARLRFFSE